QGRSLVPLLRNPAAAWDAPAITQVHRGGKEIVDGYSIRTARYRYTAWNQGAEGDELYDYETDPRELHNLAAAPDSEPVKRKLKAALESIVRARQPGQA